MDAPIHCTPCMTRLPAIFVSHGSPTFAIDPGVAGPALLALGKQLPRPKAALIVSPHWMTPAPRVTTSVAPSTLHDFGGFPQALYALNYPAPGHPGLANRTVQVLNAAGWAAAPDAERGLDHGAWVPLGYLLPQADLPVFQVSLPTGLDGAQAYAFGQALAPLADEGVLIIGSGSLTHNLHEVRFDAPHTAGEAYALAFTAWVRDTLQARDHERLKRTMTLAPQARRAHPTPEHLWPLMVAAGVAGANAQVIPVEGGITHGVLSMDAFLFEPVRQPEGFGPLVNP